MNNLSNSIKNFIGNKNTVTILGVILCIIILYFAYNYRINQQVQLVAVPVAKVDIPAKTKITEDMIEIKEMPISYLSGSEYLANTENIKGKFSNIGSKIPAGSLFFTSLVVDEKELPDALFSEVEDGFVLTQFNVTLESTYLNSIVPGNIINIYFRALDDNNKAMYGKFIENVEVLSIKDESGNDVFGGGENSGPAYMYVALPEEYFILVGKMHKITTNAMEFIMVPNKVEYTDKDFEAIELTSEDVKKFINDRSVMIDSNDIENPYDPETYLNNKKNNNKNNNKDNNDNNDNNDIDE